jgi:hypothetical protein
MNTCSCGNYVDGDGIVCTRCAALRILGLDVDATEKEIRSAYLTMVKVWHPDRFQDDSTLKSAAEAKLQDINSAYEFLTMTLLERGEWKRPEHWTEHAPTDDPSSHAESTAADRRNQFFRRIRGLSRWIVPTLKNLVVLALFVVVILICRYLWIAFDVPDPNAEAVARVVDSGKDSLLKELDAPKRRFLSAVEHDLRKLNPRWFPPGSPMLPQGQDTAQEPSSPAARKAIARTSVRESAAIQAAPHTIHSYITIGSTRDEVLTQQGPPTASTEDKLVYGRSELYLKDGVVTGWRIDPVSDPIRVKLWPQGPVDTSQQFFTVFSTKDDVLVIQGTPTAFSKDKFEYGGSEVYFQNDRVVRWKNDPGSMPLKARTP